jgi:hypothetical protein
VDSLHASKISIRNHHFSWTVDFEDRPESSLNYINVNGSFEFSRKDRTTKVAINSTLIVFEKESKSNSKLRQADIKQVDIDQVRKKKYNPKFWIDNPIIKRTQFEEEAISYFEKSNSFGSYIEQ